MYIVINAPADFDVPTFRGLWRHPTCQRAQARLIEKELKEITGEDYIEKAEKVLRSYGFKKTDCMEIDISYD